MKYAIYSQTRKGNPKQETQMNAVINVTKKLGSNDYSVDGVDGTYSATRIGMFVRVKFVYRNPKYDGSNYPEHEFKCSTIGSVPIGTYEPPKANPDAKKMILECIRKHANSKLN